MKMFYIDTPINHNKESYNSVWRFDGDDVRILSLLPTECSTFFREHHCDVVNSFFFGDLPFDSNQITCNGFLFTKAVRDAKGKFGIRFEAIGICTENPDLFYNELGDAIYNEDYMAPYWDEANSTMCGYKFVCIYESDVEIAKKILPCAIFEHSPYKKQLENDEHMLYHYFS